MGRRGGAPQVVQQAASPWAPQVKHLGQLYATANHLAFEKPPREFYPGQTFANLSADELRAMDRVRARAGGSPDVDLLRNQARGILNSDPKLLREIIGPRVGDLLPQIQGQFAKAGRFHGGLARNAEQELVAREMSRARSEAAQTLKELRGEEYMDAAKLAAVGELQREMEQQAIDEKMARHDFAQMEPWERLRNYQAAILGHFQPTDTYQATRLPGGSRLSSMLGGGLGGANIGAAFGGPGAAIGAGLGVLAGLF